MIYNFLLLQAEATALLSPILEKGLIFFLMAIIIYVLYKRCDKLEDKLEAKNEYIQQNGEKLISTLSEVRSTLDKVIETQISGDQTVKDLVIIQSEALKRDLTDTIKDLLDHLPNDTQARTNEAKI